ncbi:MAG: signal peptide peptidase SppA [Phycisphaeraceae bacterium]|nr:signal peptide peptidase SppA [Phycisphaeraceae bacterium]
MRHLMLVISTLCLVACGPMTFVVGVQPGDQQLQTQVVQRDDHAPALFPDRVAMIDITGVILNAEKPGLIQSHENPVSVLTEQLEHARQDSRVKAVLLRINSPGGTVTASDAMYREIRRWKQRTGKPVVALIMDLGASGAYYAACAADRIIAYPTSITGSIGVIFQTVSFQPALGRIGIETQALTSGPNKDAGSWLSRLSPEQRAVLQKLVDDFYLRFIQIVREARPHIPPDQFAAVTDGRVLSGTDALRLGVVDQLGDLHDAFDLAKQQARIGQAELVVYHRPLKYVGSPYARSPAQPADAGIQVNLAQINLPDGMSATSAGFYYLWSAGPLSPAGP